MSKKLTEEQINFIILNRGILLQKDIAIKLGVSKDCVNRYSVGTIVKKTRKGLTPRGMKVCNYIKGEVWVPTKGFEGIYEVSSFGRVRQEKIDDISGFKLLMKIYIKNKYLSVNLRKGKKINKLVHRLVAESFLPNPLNLSQVNHIDGNKLNNTVTNLEWCTRKYNMEHAVKNGLVKRGEERHNTKLSEKTVRNVLSVRKSTGLGEVLLHRNHFPDINVHTIWSIINNPNYWKNIDRSDYV